MFPFLELFKSGAYPWTLFMADFRAGLTVAFVVVPSAIALSSLALVDPISALISAIWPPIIYSFIGMSGQLAIGPEAMSSVLVGLAVHRELESDPTANPALVASSIGLLSGLVSIFFSIIQAGFIGNVLSGYLLTGFVLGVSNVVIVEQLPSFLSLPKLSGLETASAVQKLIAYCKVLPSAHVPSVLFGLSCLVFLFTFKFIKSYFGPSRRWVNSIPDILLLVILAIIISYAMNLSSYGIATLGLLDSNLYPPSIPTYFTSWKFVERNITLVATIVIVGFFESLTVIRKFGREFNYFPSGDRVLFSLGFLNVINGFLGGYSAFGSLPRSKIQANAGATTQVTSLIVGILVLIIMFALRSVLQYLPKPSLAAIVIVAAYGLIEWDELHHLFRMRNRGEILKFLVTWACTVFLSVSLGVIACILVSSYVIIQQSTSLSLAVMGKLETERKSVFVDLKQHPEAKVLDRVLVIQLRGSFQYYNSAKLVRRLEMLEDAIELMVKTKQDNVLLDAFDAAAEPSTNFLFVKAKTDHDGFKIILDFSETWTLDSSAILTLLELVHSKKYQIYFVGLEHFQIDLMNQAGLLELIGHDHVFDDTQLAFDALDVSSLQQP